MPGRRGSVPGQPLHQARQPAAGPGVQGHPGQAGEDREILIYTLLPLFFIEHFWSHKIFSFVKEVKKVNVENGHHVTFPVEIKRKDKEKYSGYY